jgi:hypothetical protein
VSVVPPEADPWSVVEIIQSVEIVQNVEAVEVVEAVEAAQVDESFGFAGFV